MLGGRIRAGTDVVEVPRLRAALERRPGLAERMLTADELVYCRGKADPVPSMAVRIAAKEAVGKLLGTGILSWQEIEVVPGRPPVVRLGGSTATWAATLGSAHIALSLSHTAGVAVAVAVAERLPAADGGPGAMAEDRAAPNRSLFSFLSVEHHPGGLRPDQVRALDKAAIDLGIPGPVLMERAALGVAELVLQRYAGRHTLIVCGRGNNGGDGLAAARQLHLAGHPVVCVVAVASAGDLGPDAALNLRAAEGAGVNLRLGDVPAYLWDETELVVDCLLGTGAARALREPVAGWAERIERAAARGVPVIAVDVPTGVDAEMGAMAPGTVAATCTITFHAPKSGLLCPPGSEAAGEVLVWDIGLPGFLDPEPDVRVVTAADVSVPGRRVDDHKYRAGFVAVIAGSADYPGAAHLAAWSAVRSGAGYVRLVTPPKAAAALRARLIEVVVRAAEPPEFLAAVTDERIGALVIGPGLGREAEVVAAVREVVTGTAAPLVLDADGILSFAGAADLLTGRPGMVLTPHAGELAALLAVPVSEVTRAALPAARRAAALTGQVVVLKGSSTVIAGPDGETWVVTQGPPQLASAGTGDVLSGCLGALLAKGVAPMEAAKSAVWLHAEAGRWGAAAFSAGLAAEDLIALIPRVMAGHIEERRPGWTS